MWTGPTYHFVGCTMIRPGPFDGQCSSPIRVFNTNFVEGITTSGTIYRLMLRCKQNDQNFFDYRKNRVFITWCKHNEITKKRNVTEKFLKGNPTIKRNMMNPETFMLTPGESFLAVDPM
jgi:hypothetical protein